MLGVTALGVTSNSDEADASTRNGNIVTVQSGDTLSEISTTYNTSVDQLVKDNNITNEDFIQVGQQLNLTGSVNQQPVSHQPVIQPQTNQQPVNQQPVSQPQTNQQPVDNTNSNNQSSSEQEAKEWIAQHESSGSYTAQNGQYVGRYQLSSSYLNGDYSPANQEQVADQYVASRYGSWSAAKNFWLSHNYY
ncbi:peptidoglycan-binding protein LysM [Lactobacillus phage LfeInf]|uniref:Peptidoglycan-binding protein LysM n=1 Tax=Lactobacillus phage LfeInf TaxID=1567484 RepID=A0A0A7NNK8_9CAUD|nr:transglycosylase [Lactobacillus phage LfeInf]AIZ94671.1 peptidoglycan-binding protein LysM [Lactobacillus phage LfeInf]